MSGRFNESIHISQVDFIVETSWDIPKSDPKINDIDLRLPSWLWMKLRRSLPAVRIGAMPNTVGSLIAQSDLRDLGVQKCQTHT